MRTVYLGNKFISFTDSPPADAPWVAAESELSDMAKLLQKLENYKGVYLKSPDPEASYGKFCAFFRIADAGGGLVADAAGRLLAIFRRGVWDLPKGWREPGESYEQCALREVREECGLDGLVLGEFIVRTEHIYPLGDEWILKRCMWYRMGVDGHTSVTPQTEEDIDEVRWFAPQELETAVAGSFATVREVVACALHPIG